MTVLYLAAPALAFVVLAAHFLRASNGVAIVICAVMIALLLGAIEWLHLAVVLVLARQAMGEAFLRLAFILGGVALFTALSALVFRTERLRGRFGLGVARPQANTP